MGRTAKQMLKEAEKAVLSHGCTLDEAYTHQGKRDSDAQILGGRLHSEHSGNIRRADVNQHRSDIGHISVALGADIVPAKISQPAHADFKSRLPFGCRYDFKVARQKDSDEYKHRHDNPRDNRRFIHGNTAGNEWNGDSEQNHAFNLLLDFNGQIRRS